jgi:RNA polymerase sigma factor (sigma-70 family)
MTDDAELLRRYAEERSERAFAEIVHRHVDLVYSAAARRLHDDPHAAADVAQQVFTALARQASALTRGNVVLPGWLYRTTRNVAVDFVRAEKRRRAREQEADTMNRIEAHSAATADWDRLRPMLDDAMDNLSDRDREAVLLRFFARRPFAEIGATLNLSEDAARMRVERALDKLHALLTRRGVTSTSAALAVALSAQAVAAAPAGVAASVAGAAFAAGAGTSGLAAGAGVFTFMSTAKIAATIVVVGGLAGVGFGLYSIQRSQAAEESLAALTAERSAWQAKLREADARATAAEKRAVSAEARTADAPRAVTGDPAKPAGGRGGTMSAAELASARDKLDKVKEKLAQEVDAKLVAMSDPEVQRTRIEMERIGMGLRFSQLYRNLNLTPEQVARFEARWIESRQEGVDILAAAKSNGVAPDDPVIRTLASQGKEKYENDMRAILGETGFAEYQNYERSYPARDVVGGMLANLTFAGAPLSSDQMNQLTRAIAEQSVSYQKGGRVGERGNDVNWPAVVAQAQQFLSPAQVDQVRAQAEVAQASQQAMRAGQQVMQTNEKAGPKAPGAGKPRGG